MFNKTAYAKIRDARASHARWVRRAKHLIEGLPVSEDLIPIDSTACAFGVWLYDEGMRYKTRPELSAYLNSIEKKHNELHDVYLSIYKIYFVDTKPSWFRSLVTKQLKEVSPQKREQAEAYFKVLQEVSDELITTLEDFEASLRRTSPHMLAS